MKTFWAVLKTQLNQTFGFSYFRYLYKNSRPRFFRRLAFVPLMLLALVPLLKLITDMYRMVFEVLHPLGQDALIFALAFVLSQSLALVFGLFYLMSHFYLAKDLDILVPLPVKPSVILGAKFLIVVISEYMVMLPIVLPALFVYGVNTGPPWTFWILASFISLLLPIFPLALSSIFVMLLMKVTSAAKGRGVMRVAGAFFGIFIFTAVQWLQYRFRKSGPQDMSDLIAGPNGLVHLVTRKFPPSLWAAEGLLHFPKPAGFYYLALFTGSTLVITAVLYFLADRVFYKGLIGGNEVSAKRKKIVTNRETFKACSPFQALFIREWRNLTRSASFLMPVLVNTLMFPLALVVPVIFASGENLAGLVNKIQADIWFRYIVIFIAAGLITWLGAANCIAITALSREGQTFWISKILPVSPFLQVLSKLALAFVFPLFLTGLVLLGEALLLHFPPGHLAMQALLAMIGSLLIMGFSLHLDLLNPKLDWTDPQQVMKRNYNAIISVFSTMGFIGLNAGFIVFLAQEADLSPSLTYLSVTVLWLLLLGLITWLLFSRVETCYRKIEL
ncbi:MAG: hypothetical protein CVV03_06460 [Firmicutes bacterium HGW-Firmicutes-8]|nr:MAG: hypothetical protein CVV03_06460 [Firmicutes bacterium HGW-Firmicutes-8]